MDDSTLRPSRQHTVRWLVPVVLATGVLAVLGVVWWWAPWHAASPVTVRGTAYASEPRTAIGFDVDSRLDAVRFGLDEGVSFDVEGAMWAGPDGAAWNIGGPVECLRRADETYIELRFIEVRYGDGPGGPTRLVTSVQCLE